MVEPLRPGAAGMDIFTDIIESLLRPPRDPVYRTRAAAIAFSRQLAL